MAGKGFAIILAGVLIGCALSSPAFAEQTFIYGKTLMKQTQAPVGDVALTITCNISGGEKVTTSSDSQGLYGTWLTDCPQGTEVIVKATKGSLKGEDTGTPDYNGDINLNIGLIDAELYAPEIEALIAVAVLVAPALAYASARKKTGLP